MKILQTCQCKHRNDVPTFSSLDLLEVRWPAKSRVVSHEKCLEHSPFVTLNSISTREHFLVPTQKLYPPQTKISSFLNKRNYPISTLSLSIPCFPVPKEAMLNPNIFKPQQCSSQPLTLSIYCCRVHRTSVRPILPTEPTQEADLHL